MLQPEAHQEQIESYIKMSKRDGDYAGRVICIGLNERHDWIALHEIADWLEMNAGVIAHSYDISSSISVDQLDHYDMSTRPKKGDALKALRKHKDVICVIALHLFGIDGDFTKESDKHYCYTEENHKLFDLCMRRGIPLLVWGDQPVRKNDKLPKGVECHDVGTSSMYTAKPKVNGTVGLVYPIYLYEKAAK